MRVGHEATKARVGARARPSRGARWLDVTSRARSNRDASGGVLRALANVAFCYTASVYVEQMCVYGHRTCSELASLVTAVTNAMLRGDPVACVA